jgi:hypothetical protein
MTNSSDIFNQPARMGINYNENQLFTDRGIIALYFRSKKYQFLVDNFQFGSKSYRGVELSFNLVNPTNDADFFFNLVEVDKELLNLKKSKYIFDISIKNYIFMSCLVTKVTHKQPINISCHADIVELGEYSKSVGTRLEELLEFEPEVLGSSIDSVRYFIDLAGGDENMLNEIEKEIHYFIHNNDIFFEKKLNGEIKYL